MTERQLNRICEQWIGRLNLDHWEIDLHFDKKFEEDNGDYAEVIMSDNYDEAEIRLNPEMWMAWDKEKANKIIAHELLHLHLDRIKIAAEECRGALANDTWYLYTKRLTHELEHSVEALTVALFRELGAA